MYPEDLKYTAEHEWIKVEGNRGRIGITSFAQDQLGDVVYVELPKVGGKVTQFAVFGVVDSVKASSDLYCPVTGTITAVNDALQSNPELVASAHENLFTSGTLGRYSKILNSVIERKAVKEAHQ